MCHPPRTAISAAAVAVLAFASGIAAQPSNRHPPVLTAFALNDGAASTGLAKRVRLVHSVVGTPPSDYRVSTRADFAGAPWLPYVRTPEIDATSLSTTTGCDRAAPSRQLRLFLQVRAPLGNEIRVVNGQRVLVPVTAESNVMADSICVPELPASPRGLRLTQSGVHPMIGQGTFFLARGADSPA